MYNVHVAWDYVRGFVCTRAYFIKLYCALFMNIFFIARALIFQCVSFFGDSRFLKINLKFAWKKEQKEYIDTRLALYISKECKQNVAIEKRVNFSVKHTFSYAIMLICFGVLVLLLSISPSFSSLCSRNFWKWKQKFTMSINFQAFWRAINRWPKKNRAT